MFTHVLSESQWDRRGGASSTMAFFYEFLEHLISKCMEDPEERRIKLNEALKQNLEDAKKAYVARRRRRRTGPTDHTREREPYLGTHGRWRCRHVAVFVEVRNETR